MRPHLLCTLFVGVDQTPVEGCKIVFPDEVFRLEHPVKVSDRDEKLDREMNQKVERVGERMILIVSSFVTNVSLDTISNVLVLMPFQRRTNGFVQNVRTRMTLSRLGRSRRMARRRKRWPLKLIPKVPTETGVKDLRLL